MAERLIRWFFFSVGLTLLPVVISFIFRITFNLDIFISNYIGEFIFMAVTLAATSMGDVVSIIKKGATGIHTTILLSMLIFIALICMSIYVMENTGKELEIVINSKMINLLTIVGCSASIIIGVVCQVFLEKIEG